MLKFVLAIVAFACAMPAAAQDGRWIRAETANFIIYSDNTETRTRLAAQKLEGFDSLLRTLAPPPYDGEAQKLEIYLLRQEASLRELGKDPRQIAGFYAASIETMASIARYRGDNDFSQDTLFHEYAHHYMLRYFPIAYPSWFIEGFAEYVSTVEIERDHFTFARYAPRAQILLRGSWLPMEQILSSRTSQIERDDRQHFYAQSWLFTHYCANTPGCTPRLQDYFRRLRAGADPIAAFPEAFAVSPADMQDAQRQYLHGPMRHLTIPRTPVEYPVAISRLSRGADDLLTAWLRLRLHVSDDELPALQGRINQTAGAYPNDAFAQRVRARMLIAANAPAQARDVLAPIVAADPDDIEAVYLVGLSFVTEAQTSSDPAPLIAQARRNFVSVYRRDDAYVPALFRYAITFSPMSPEQLDVLLLAHSLAPQVDVIAIHAAAELMNAGRFGEAAMILRPIAYDPHGGEGADAARRLLEAAAARAAATEPAPPP